jgi:hypothetical protein
MGEFPKKLWLMWDQGLAHAPLLVQRCVASWIERNPGWQVVVLDRNNLHEHLHRLDVPEATLARLNATKKSNLVRLQLLAEHGGVWTDATTWCARPLDEWLHELDTSGFFAFRNPGPDRLLSNWFLASQPGHHLVQRWRVLQADFFRRHHFPVQGPGRLRIAAWLGGKLSRDVSSTHRWLNPLLTRGLRIYPYFICHYLFERAVAGDPECARAWAATPVRSADPPHAIQTHGPWSTPTTAMREEIEQRQVPVYKLSWRIDAREFPPDSLLGYLLES